MSQLIHTHSVHVRTRDGVEYIPRVYGREERPGGTWLGWIEFHPTVSGPPILRTGTETSQPNLDALDYWAGGLQPIYIDGAFERALRH